MARCAGSITYRQGRGHKFLNEGRKFGWEGGGRSSGIAPSPDNRDIVSPSFLIVMCSLTSHRYGSGWNETAWKSLAPYLLLSTIRLPLDGLVRGVYLTVP